jgi:hypothetical protein
MVNNNIDIFVMSYKESVYYFKPFEKLEKIRHTDDPATLPADTNQKSVTSSRGKSS